MRKARVPWRHIDTWPAKQLWRFAYLALERESLCGEQDRAHIADTLMDKMNAHTITKEELKHWAMQEVTHRMY